MFNEVAIEDGPIEVVSLVCHCVSGGDASVSKKALPTLKDAHVGRPVIKAETVETTSRTERRHAL